MTRFRLVALGVMVAVVGCGRPDVVPTPEESPLTVEQWKTLPADQKYEVATFERLKAGDPKLQEPKAWEKFNRDVLLPARKKDFPNGKTK
ncbi:MAG: hypothetical protein ABGY75_02775 [Gemmataceae bacterium]